MIYYSIPYSINRNIGAYYNSVMENLPNDTDFACFVDGDTIFTTSNFGDQITDVIKKYPECRFFTCYTNRVGCKIQICPIIDRDNNDMEYHRNMGKLLQDNYWDLCDDISKLESGILISGMFLLIRKDLWKEVDGFKSGMLSVDNDFHFKCIAKKEPIYLMKGVYIYHWYRWPNVGNISHLKPEKNIVGVPKITVNRKVVYTCIYGRYDVLKDPLVVNPNWDYICFTDQPFISNIWNIQKIPIDCLSEDSKKIQRKMKILSHRYLKNYDWSIWTDGNLQMNVDPQDLLNIYGKNSFNISAHPERTCVYDELDACERLGKDNTGLINEIRKKLIDEKYPVNNGLIQSGIIIRNHTDDTITGLAEAWWCMVKEYSHRDQATFNYIVWKYPNLVKKLHLFSANVLYNYFNFYHHRNVRNGEIKKHPGKLYGTLTNHINGKLFFNEHSALDYSGVLPKKVKR